MLDYDKNEMIFIKEYYPLQKYRYLRKNHLCTELCENILHFNPKNT